MKSCDNLGRTDVHRTDRQTHVRGIVGWVGVDWWGVVAGVADPEQQEMGVKDLMRVLKSEAPGAIVSHGDWSVVRGRRVAVDATLFLVTAVKTLGPGTRVRLADVYVQRFHSQLLAAGASHIVHVFDGPHKPQKAKAHTERSSARDRLKTKQAQKQQERKAETNVIKQADLEMDLQKLEVQLRTVTVAEVLETRELLQSQPKCEVRRAMGDAEQECVKMALAGEVDLVFSNDTDAIVFGAPILLRCVHKDIQEIRHAAVLEALRCNAEQLVEASLAAGCDYCDKLPGVGLTTALARLRQHGSLSGWRTSEPRVDAFLRPREAQWQAARELMLSCLYDKQTRLHDYIPIEFVHMD